MAETEKPWPERVTAVVAAQVERYRKEQNLRGDDLAQRCVDLGYRGFDKSTLSKLATGVRKSLSVAELLVLAAALRVPPEALLLPLGEQATVEILPAAVVGLDLALLWLEAAAPVPLPTPDGEAIMMKWVPATDAVNDLRAHAHAMWDLRAARIRLEEASIAAGRSGQPDSYAENLRALDTQVLVSEEALRRIRDRLRRSGWKQLPELWDEGVTADA